MSNYLDEVLGFINEKRISLDLKELTSIEIENINNSFYSEVRIIINEEILQGGKLPIEYVIEELSQILQSKDENTKKLLTSVATHVAVDVDESDDSVEVNIKILNKYLELEPIGPFIAGDLVIQGYSLESNYAPAICKVEFASFHDEDYQDICTIMPWEMIYQGADENGADSFAIPITLPNENIEGTAHITIYVDLVKNIPQAEPSDSYSIKSPHLITAVDFFTPVTPSNQSNKNNDGNNDNIIINNNNDNNNNIHSSYEIITSIKSSSGINTAALVGGDNMLLCPFIDMNNGYRQLPEDHEWKFSIAIEKTESTHMAGLEDVIFVVRDEDTGELDVPEGYEIDSSNLLEDENDIDTSIHLAYKMGPDPLFSSLFLLSCDEDTDLLAESVFQSYIDRYLGGGAEIRMAPSLLNQAHGYRIALLLIYKGNDIAESFFNQGAKVSHSGGLHNNGDKNSNGSHRVSSRRGSKKSNYIESNPNIEDDDEVSHITGDDLLSRGSKASRESSDDDDDEDDGDDQFNLDEEAITQLTKRLSDLEIEKERALTLNMDLQKKCSSILARIGRDTQSRNGPADNNLQQQQQQVDGNDSNQANGALNLENNTEKENHFLETLTSIADGRNKLLKQQSEYEQLAYDLQTRLDDKEYKAEEISESLNEFKREILTKAENSRTAQGLSKRLIKQYELNEKKKDSELEKVRLRNISLKTTLKRLEKTLRSREQLAEGLHMIDFEQLKIENQTLSEKIEERNEELSKLKRKKTITVQILTHIREKLRYIETQNVVISNNLVNIERDIINTRNSVTLYKHNREVLRDDNVELKRQRGFATSDLLIIDYEVRKNTIELLQQNIKELQERHFLLTKQITTNKLKIMQNTRTKNLQYDPNNHTNNPNLFGSTGTYGSTNGSGLPTNTINTGNGTSEGGERIGLPPIGKDSRNSNRLNNSGYKGKLRK